MRRLYAVPVFLLLFLGSCTSDLIEETLVLEAENVITIEQDLMEIVNEHRLSLNTNMLQFSDVAYKIKSTAYDDTEEVQLKALYKAIHHLNDIDKALIFLYLEDKPYKEISETLGISSVNARVKMNRAKEKLKNILNP